ncbi:hypothetical protein D3C80_1420110 [compost metagenome]
MLEQHIAAQRVADGIQRCLWALRTQVVDGFGEVLAGAGVVAARQQVRFARATAPVQCDAGPAAVSQGLLHTNDVGRAGRTCQPVQHQHQGGIGLVRTVPVEVEEIAIGQPQALALAVQGCRLAPERPPKRLQMRIAQPQGGFEGAGGGGIHRGVLADCFQTSVNPVTDTCPGRSSVSGSECGQVVLFDRRADTDLHQLVELQVIFQHDLQLIQGQCLHLIEKGLAIVQR